MLYLAYSDKLTPMRTPLGVDFNRSLGLDATVCLVFLFAVHPHSFSVRRILSFGLPVNRHVHQFSKR